MSMNLKYIDIHAHADFPDFDADREEVVARAASAGVGMINVGTDLVSSRHVVELAEKHDPMWAIVGMHPTHIAEVAREGGEQGLDGAMDELALLAAHPKVIAIGECGLDYFRSQLEDIERQREAFVRHIDLANATGKPLMLHVRNGKESDHNAYQEAISMLKEHAKVRANFHFFAGSVDDAKAIVEMGNTVSFTGVLTFARDYDEVVRGVPLESMMSETDCPFVAPLPHRGKRNEPVYVVEVVRKIAEIRGEEESLVRDRLVQNAIRVFGLR